MISINYLNDFKLQDEEVISNWISSVISLENCIENEINFVFCNDDYLHKLNVDFLDHDTLTDVISFDYSVGKKLQGDVFISSERVAYNAKNFGVSFQNETHRVMVHGILHYCGYKDKTDNEAKIMREKENSYLNLLK